MQKHAESPLATLAIATYLGVREKPNPDDLEFELPALLVKKGTARDQLLSEAPSTGMVMFPT